MICALDVTKEIQVLFIHGQLFVWKLHWITPNISSQRSDRPVNFAVNYTDANGSVNFAENSIDLLLVASLRRHRQK